jgi:hypothetical protein
VIHLAPNASTLTVFHEALHWASHNAGFGQRMGQFVNEGMTEWLTQRAFGSQAYRINYAPNVAFVRILTEYVGEEALTIAYLDGEWRPLNTALLRLLRSSDAVIRFYRLLQGAPVGGIQDARQALGMLPR